MKKSLASINSYNDYLRELNRRVKTDGRLRMIIDQMTADYAVEGIDIKPYVKQHLSNTKKPA